MLNRSTFELWGNRFLVQRTLSNLCDGVYSALESWPMPADILLRLKTYYIRNAFLL